MTLKTAYITGGASGIGLAVAQALSERKMRIVIADINLSAAQEAVKQLSTTALAGEEHLAVEVDVSSWDSQLAAFEKAVAMFKAIDVVIVNAGVGEKAFVHNDGGKGQGFVKPDLRILDVDLEGFLYTSALAIQQMRRQDVRGNGLRGKSEESLNLNMKDTADTTVKSLEPRRCADFTAFQVGISLPSFCLILTTMQHSRCILQRSSKIFFPLLLNLRYELMSLQWCRGIRSLIWQIPSRGADRAQCRLSPCR